MKRNLPAVLAVFIAAPAFAQSFHVSSSHQSYILTLDKTFAELREPGFSEKVMKTKCNRTLFDSFVQKVRKHSRALPKFKSDIARQSAIRVSIDGRKKVALRFDKSGNFFSALPAQFKNLWLASEETCSR